LPKSTDLPWRFEAVGPSVHRIRVSLPRAEDECWALLTSDVHWDNPKSDRDAYREHLHEAVRRRAFVIDNGDWFCAMQGKYDKRSSKSSVRPEHQNGNYLDSLVNTAADWLQPFAANLTTLGTGNHEQSINDRHETSLTDRLAAELRNRYGSPATRHGYAGFVVLDIDRAGRRHSLKMFRHHGYGGGGPVTKDVIQTNRQAVYLADADVVLTGHTHDSWQLPIQRIRLSQGHEIEQTRQVHVKCAGYKDHYGQSLDSWEISKGHPPKVRGAWWLRIFNPRGSDSRGKLRQQFELIEAVA